MTETLRRGYPGMKVGEAFKYKNEEITAARRFAPLKYEGRVIGSLSILPFR